MLNKNVKVFFYAQNVSYSPPPSTPPSHEPPLFDLVTLTIIMSEPTKSSSLQQTYIICILMLFKHDSKLEEIVAI